MALTKADARRWLTARSGRELDTAQVRPDGMEWRPGPRTLTADGNQAELDGSQVRLTADHVVLECGDRLIVEWLDSDGVTIHWTTYTDVPDTDDIEDEADEADDYDPDAVYADAAEYLREVYGL
jgi:hypothetical protein